MNDANVNQPPTYKEEAAQYTKKDAIYALLFFAAIMVLNVVVPIWISGYWVNLGFNIVQFVILLVILKKRGQGLRSVGLHFMDFKKVLVVGLVFAVIVILINGLIPGIIMGFEMLPAIVLMGNAARVFVQALYEDIFYVGYFQTRIYGLIKRDWLAVFVGSFIFAIAHWPWHIRMAMASAGGLNFDFWSSLAFLTFYWMVMHIVFFNGIFRHMRSIIPVTLFHFAGNFAGLRSMWAEGLGHGGHGAHNLGFDSNEMIFRGIAFGLVSVILWWIFPYIKKRRAVK